jgi:hypothetical protein
MSRDLPSAVLCSLLGPKVSWHSFEAMSWHSFEAMSLAAPVGARCLRRLNQRAAPAFFDCDRVRCIWRTSASHLAGYRICSSYVRWDCCLPRQAAGDIVRGTRRSSGAAIDSPGRGPWTVCLERPIPRDRAWDLSRRGHPSVAAHSQAATVPGVRGVHLAVLRQSNGDRPHQPSGGARRCCCWWESVPAGLGVPVRIRPLQAQSRSSVTNHSLPNQRAAPREGRERCDEVRSWKANSHVRARKRRVQR